MKEGEILQCGRGEELFYAPESVYAAKFMGEGNFIPGKVENGVFKTDFLSFIADKPEGEYYLFLRERQLQFYKLSEVLESGKTDPVNRKTDSIDGSTSSFYPISTQCIGDSWRVIWENKNGLKLHNLTNSPQEMEELPYGVEVQVEKNAILFSKEEVWED